MLFRTMAVMAMVVSVSVLCPEAAPAQVEILEFYCPSCGYRKQFKQGSEPGDLERNIQHIIVVCERSGEIRNIPVPIDPNAPVSGEPLVARQYGVGQSDLLGLKLPRFLIPGNTCPLFPVTAYLKHNICPVDGKAGIQFAVVARY